MLNALPLFLHQCRIPEVSDWNVHDPPSSNAKRTTLSVLMVWMLNQWNGPSRWTAIVFQRHYNRPMLEDRLARRDVLPGSDGTRQSPMEKLGAAYWKFEHGLLDKAQLEHVLELTRLAERTQKTTNREDSPSYA